MNKKVGEVTYRTLATQPCVVPVTFLYTVNHKKGGSTFVIITLENLDATGVVLRVHYKSMKCDFFLVSQDSVRRVFR